MVVPLQPNINKKKTSTMIIYFIRIDKKSNNCETTHIIQPLCYRTFEKAQAALAKHLSVLVKAPNHKLTESDANHFTFEVITPINTYMMTYRIDDLVTR